MIAVVEAKATSTKPQKTSSVPTISKVAKQTPSKVQAVPGNLIVKIQLIVKAKVQAKTPKKETLTTPQPPARTIKKTPKVDIPPPQTIKKNPKNAPKNPSKHSIKM